MRLFGKFKTFLNENQIVTDINYLAGFNKDWTGVY